MIHKQMIDTQQLLQYNQLGLIPGPEESEEAFLERANYCINIQTNIETKVPQLIPGEAEKISACSKEALALTQTLYDIKPDWIPLFFSNYKLAPWHGGCAWIFQLTDKDPTSSFFQLRQVFKKKTAYLGLYQREELIAHELSHVGRMMFLEPKFEEIHAYRSSPSKFRRWFGPIVQSSFESMLFVLLLFLILMIDGFFMMSDQPEGLKLAMWAKLLPIGLILIAVVRLWRRQTVYAKCLGNLERLADKKAANAIIYRLQDSEIQTFSKMDSEAIINYATQQKEKSIRWRLLSHYFENFLRC